MLKSEFHLINNYFNHVTSDRSDIKIGIGDDCAILDVPKNKFLAISNDTFVSGTHFPVGITPEDIAYKVIGAALSDLAAVGATPAWLTLALTLPNFDETWITHFSSRVHKIIKQYQLQIIGGDTTRGPLAINLGVYGYVSHNRLLKRSGANHGDRVYVTGTLGDSAAGLAILLGKLKVCRKEDQEYFKKRHLRPNPRIFYGNILSEFASAAIDVSDGLIADLNHVLKSSNVLGAYIYYQKIPYSSVLKRNVSEKTAIKWALYGGEDYELCFTVSKIKEKALKKTIRRANIKCTCIGKVTNRKKSICIMNANNYKTVKNTGYDHFVNF